VKEPERYVRSRAAAWLLTFLVLPVCLVLSAGFVVACCLVGVAFELFIGAR
jgi:hypothetical protein